MKFGDRALSSTHNALFSSWLHQKGKTILQMLWLYYYLSVQIFRGKSQLPAVPACHPIPSTIHGIFTESHDVCWMLPCFPPSAEASCSAHSLTPSDACIFRILMSHYNLNPQFCNDDANVSSDFPSKSQSVIYKGHLQWVQFLTLDPSPPLSLLVTTDLSFSTAGTAVFPCTSQSPDGLAKPPKFDQVLVTRWPPHALCKQ